MRSLFFRNFLTNTVPNKCLLLKCKRYHAKIGLTYLKFLWRPLRPKIGVVKVLLPKPDGALALVVSGLKGLFT
jgi:hypothetical protein